MSLPFQNAVGGRHSLCLGYAHAQGAGVGVHVGERDFRVAGESPQPAKFVDQVEVQQPEACQHGV